MLAATTSARLAFAGRGPEIKVPRLAASKPAVMTQVLLQNTYMLSHSAAAHGSSRHTGDPRCCRLHLPLLPEVNLLPPLPPGIHRIRVTESGNHPLPPPTLQNATLPRCSPASLPSTGIIILQGPHHAAEKSTTTSCRRSAAELKISDSSEDPMVSGCTLPSA